MKKQNLAKALGLAAAAIVPAVSDAAEAVKPNILWIVSEDNSAYFTHCYGNAFATTPNIDKLAGEGFLYTRAYCTNAVCSPTRNSIITGSYAASNGNEQMRSEYPLPGVAGTYAAIMKNAGYYCTNNEKTDYNTPGIVPSAIWDESSNKAHYRNRPAGKPFFAVFNSMISHESCLFQPIPNDKLRHDPAKVVLPPYHPDTPEMRHDWAQYYDKIEDMDTWVGTILKELEESGLADNTIVFYYGDNGGVLARSKRFVYETGTHIPLVIRIPDKYKYLYPAGETGSKVHRIVNSVDFAPTVLSIAGVPIPEYMQGKAFLGQKSEDPSYAFMSRQRMDERYDMVRAVRDNQFRYIRNYMPFRITMQHVSFLFNAASAQSWEDAFKAGKTNELQSRFFLPKPIEELYDTEKDPWELHNLAADPAYREVLLRMRGALHAWMQEVRDVALIPETDYDTYGGGKSMYEYMRTPACPFDELLTASERAILGSKQDIPIFLENLKSNHAGIRYWGVTGLLVHKSDAKGAVPALKELSDDPSVAVRTLVAETLHGLGEKEVAWKIYTGMLRDTVHFNMTDRTFVLNSVDAIDDKTPEMVEIVKDLYMRNKDKIKGFARYNLYDISISEYLLKEWGAI